MQSSPAYGTDAHRWQAVLTRNVQADDQFVYAVTTTLIYCRPTCPSRRPNRENVRFFDTWRTAEKNGFRPCKRCAPQATDGTNPNNELVIQACKMIEEAEQEPTLNELAAAVGLSPSHFHRVFKQAVGITPKQYAMENRLNRMRNNLPDSATVTDALYEAGYESSSRFYATATERLGMKPSVYKKGGKGKMIRYAVVPSSLGWVLIAATEKGICRIEFDDAVEPLRDSIRALFPLAELEENPPEFKSFVEETVRFLEEPGRDFSLPLDIQGTAFQRRVWRELQNIPPGTTVPYGEVAARVGTPKAARAVAQACAANKLAVAIPCHRVVRSDGALGGYRWGVERKRTILQRESGGLRQKHA
ncbi:MAG: bifunctional DNA-binding transcriptional regulator/O6-methylguanine-DNA methyltransferase Ada [Caldilineaceae bacterium]|nr:bifunctional DNA-binding transcriptional regulator/O6-methylguanine-DNA methyltransferase Ada [Caldilineaceae bacterium]